MDTAYEDFLYDKEMAARRPVYDNFWQEWFIKTFTPVAKKYNYHYVDNPHKRALIPLRMLKDLGFTQAAIILANKPWYPR